MNGAAAVPDKNTSKPNPKRTARIGTSHHFAGSEEIEGLADQPLGLLVLSCVVEFGQMAFSRLSENNAGQPHLLFEKVGHGHAKTAQAGWCNSKIRLEEPLEFPDRLFIEHDVVDVRDRLVGLLQAALHRVLRETRIVLLSCEPLLLHRGNDIAVTTRQAGLSW